ncbi:VIT1/CCC1 transporter family protein [Fructilactobacillus fructivorans]|uniref:VIT1/CCC1 transporter family protein n=1 Tax=Fructilactobacillus fructivorans TaxID=1614 RepID=UPI0007050B87|nr:VIT family protein [Fructilactobacillus fructivorans]KRN42783.1 hypothetical protein IV48_GL001189 [Fructilactobacillus fructivorans]
MAKKKTSLAQKINVLRASVMGANDGILSVAGIVLGVAGASTSNWAILISGLAGMLAGTVSMTMGEYVSVNTPKDSQRQAIDFVKRGLANDYDGEFNFVKNKYLKTGMAPELAEKATSEMMQEDALTTVVREKYSFDRKDFTSPYAAAIASMISFPTGSILPLVTIFVAPAQYRVLGTYLAIILALSITGYVAAVLGNANRTKSLIRNVISGLVTMTVTYLVGRLVGLVF